MSSPRSLRASSTTTRPQSALIAAHIPGRLRLRDPRLRALACAEAVAARLRALDGVQAVETNALAGSIRVAYQADDPTAMATRVCTAVAPLLPDAPQLRDMTERGATAQRASPGRRAAREWNRVAKLGMLASLPISLALAAAGTKKLHAVTGAAFTALLLVHLAVHRRHLTK